MSRLGLSPRDYMVKTAPHSIDDVLYAGIINRNPIVKKICLHSVKACLLLTSLAKMSPLPPSRGFKGRTKLCTERESLRMRLTISVELEA